MKKLLYTLGFCLVLASMSTFTSCTAEELEPVEIVQNVDPIATQGEIPVTVMPPR